MRIDCEVHAFRLKSRQAAPIIDGSVERLEGAARESKITGLVLVQPAFLNDDPAELFAQASQARMPVRVIPPLVQPLAPEVLEEWARSGAVGLALTLTDPNPLAESIEAALQLGFHLEVSVGLERREHLAEPLLADGHRLVFRGFGLADSARDPAWDPRLARPLAVAKGAGVFEAVGDRTPRRLGLGSRSQDAAGARAETAAPSSQWPHVAAAHAYAPSYAQTFEWLEELIPDEDAEGETPAAV